MKLSEKALVNMIHYFEDDLISLAEAGDYTVPAMITERSAEILATLDQATLRGWMDEAVKEGITERLEEMAEGALQVWEKHMR